jgi:DNA recombination protein RmuC
MEYAIFLAIAINIFITIILLLKSKQKKENPLYNNLSEKVDNLSKNLHDEMFRNRQENRDSDKIMREEMIDHLERFRNVLNELNKDSRQQNEENRNMIENKLALIQKDNNEKLEKMRETVDEKLQSTLQKRIGESFNLVREQLERVHEGLGKMQNLADGVGDLKKVLTNVKNRGTWAEVKLGAIIEQTLLPDQYSQNVQVQPGKSLTVEFAIKLPGKLDDMDICWLPIDAKFPQESYHRIQIATETGDKADVDKAAAELIKAVEKAAKDICDKYIAPPYTTDFAIMFLPTEGLYSEVLRVPGLLEKLQQNYRIVLAGPTTLSAILNSLQMGFRTLAIEKRASEVWSILAAVKTEFGNFEKVLAKLKTQVQTVSNTIEASERRTRVMNRKLKGLDKLPVKASADILGIDEFDTDDDIDEEEEPSS